jgi:hypothetical protein
MRVSRSSSQLFWLTRRIVPLILLLAGAITAKAACNITSGDATGYVGIPFVYQITVTGGPRSYSATGLPPGLTVNTTTGIVSGICTTSGRYSVTLSVTCNSGGDTKVVTFTITAPPIPANAFVGFRLPDFQTLPGVTYTPRLMLQMGATDPTGPHPFNATLEVDASDARDWSKPVPYNYFVGINDLASWITNAPLPVRNALNATGLPRDFGTAQLTEAQPPGPAVYMKADPRSSRFGIFQVDAAQTSNPSDARTSRIMRPLWPLGDSNAANGYGGNVVDPGGPIEHAPSRFSTTYYPATFCINGPPESPPVRDNATTVYADNDGVTRPADAIYLNTAYTGWGSSTPYNTPVYRPIMLNRPFRNVAELGYAFRDLPWKTLDFFTDKSADAGLLDIFTINDGAQVLGPNDVVRTGMPTVVAGQVNLNGVYVDPITTKAADPQAILAGSIWDEISSSTVAPNGSGAQTAETIAKNLAASTSTTAMQNKSELVTRAGVPTTILPTASNDNQVVKARREVVPRAISSVSQTRVWNLLIDVVAQSGHYKPNAQNLRDDFIVEGEQHYWVHVAIDRFTGEVIDKQIEVVNE